MEIYILTTLREKCPYSEFFWSIFSHIRTEYGKIRTRKTPNTDTFQAGQYTVFLCKSHYPHVKWHVISTVINVLYDFSQNLLNGLILKTWKLTGKFQNWIETQASVQSPLQKLIFGDSGQSSCKNKHFVQVLWSFPILLDFLTFGQTFCKGFSSRSPNQLTVLNEIDRNFAAVLLSIFLQEYMELFPRSIGNL